MSSGAIGLRVRAVALLAVTLVLAGCATIPDSGPVLPGRSAGELPRAYVRIYGVSPTPGASPEEIVRGFLQAAADVSDDRSVAREYLVAGVRATWRPEAGVVVFPSEAALQMSLYDVSGRLLQPPPTGTTGAGAASEPAGEETSGSGKAAGTGATTGTATGSPASTGTPSSTAPPAEGARVTVRIRVPVTARVDGSGHYSIAASGQQETREYGLVAVSGQWRIDRADDGVLLSRGDFDNTYWEQPVYFTDPTGTWLVPDVRWFPIGSATPTSVVKAVLAGPPQWLEPAVITAAPAGTRMTQPSVPVQEGVATVDLTQEALQADPMHRQMLEAQLEDSLAELPAISQVSIGQVEITVEGSRFDITSGPAASQPVGNPPEPGARLLLHPVVDNRPVAITQGHVVRLENDRLVTLEGLGALSGAKVSRPAVAPDRSGYAVLVDERRLLYAVAGGRATTLVDGASPLTAPSIDPIGWVWTARTGAGGAVVAARPGTPAAQVPVTGWPEDLRITSLRISRDGTRALVSGQHGGSGVLYVAAVQRDAKQVPVRLGPLLALLPDLSSARSAAWVDQRQVVVLGRRGSAPEQPWLVEIGGTASGTAPVAGAVSVTAGNSSIYVEGGDGVVYRWATVSWDKVATARWPAMPG